MTLGNGVGELRLAECATDSINLTAEAAGRLLLLRDYGKC